MEHHREFLTGWLLESGPLLGDELDPGGLGRMTVDELFTLAQERQEQLTKAIAAQQREAEALRKYGRMKFAGIRGVITGGKRGHR
jgi:hypothetical protein